MENVLINEKEQEEEARDRLSSLPRELIPNILKFLSIPDVFPMHYLSKQWTTMYWWLHIPTIKFVYKDREFTLDEYKLVRNCLNCRCHQHAKITSFKLHLLHAYTRDIGLEDIYYWLSCFSKTNTLKELDLRIKYSTTRDIFPIIPESVLLNVRSSLILLKLQDISLKLSNTSDIISPPSLITPSLINPRFENATIFQNLISGCPSIKSLQLGGRQFFLKEKESDPHSNAWKLKWVDFCALEPTSCVCVSLISLILGDVRISDEGLENLILGLPLLRD
ncbi:probable FBD-associated F-box protein At1g32375 [Ziziphus jujuba]|uniref:Probable FBD-associated F-box protein At1g32375 n=1 Tax=Ziziphus jujuba TaxID=326968 RepID=A0A6P3ZEF5_ZIZJJ|nr:probable FBD-associated F-box protein At1g32375 [Ziziphus jujuba]